MEIFEKLKDLMEKEDIGTGMDVTLDTTFKELELDSLDLVDLAMDCEDEFNIMLDLEAEDMPQTLGELVNKIEELTEEE